MDITKFAKPLQGGYSFGTDPVATASGLRDLAADIESGKLAVTEVRILGIASPEDFVTQTLIIELAPKATSQD